jgi:O-antigen/teichoic acid export membrane protein
MKPLPLIIAIAPLVVFSLMAKWLPAGDIGIAAVVAAAIAAIALLANRPHWPPKILHVTQFVMFAVIAIIAYVSKSDDSWLHTWSGAGTGIVLGAVILLLLPFVPFTEQYARQTVPRQRWSSPSFRKINRVLSGLWGIGLIGLGLSRVAAEAIDRHTSSHTLPQVLLGLIVPVGILMYLLKYSREYPEKVLSQEHGQQPLR